MRILHVPYCFHPDPVGGTEIYVEGLAQGQRTLGYESAIAAPGARSALYEHAGLPVWRFAVSVNPGLRSIYGEGDRLAAEAFARIVDEFRPDIVHLHALTSAVSILLADEVARRGIPIVLNYHTPAVSCVRGTLLKWGSEICNGALDKRTCASCMLQAHGMRRSLARAVGAVPESATAWIGAAGLSGGAWTALRMPELLGLRIAAFQRLLRTVDRVIALCDWTRSVLVRNGVPEEKIALCRQGIRWDPDQFHSDSRPAARLPLRFAFLGRLDAAKGPQIVVQALRQNSDLPVQLDLFGVRQGETGNRCAAELCTIVGDDARIGMMPPIPSGAVITQLREYDAVIVPSQALETGPLVVLEAFAARTPVIGSDLGGIAELVANGVDGLLVERFDAPAAWAAVLRSICRQPQLLDRLRAGISPPRNMRQVAGETVSIYEDLLQDCSSGRSALTAAHS